MPYGRKWHGGTVSLPLWAFSELLSDGWRRTVGHGSVLDRRPLAMSQIEMMDGVEGRVVHLSPPYAG